MSRGSEDVLDLGCFRQRVEKRRPRRRECGAGGFAGGELSGISRLVRRAKSGPGAVTQSFGSLAAIRKRLCRIDRRPWTRICSTLTFKDRQRRPRARRRVMGDGTKIIYG